MTSPIVVLGSGNLDLVTRQPRLPRPGETIAGSAFETGAGGKGLNQAIAARRAGADVAFVGAVGNDDFGARLRHALDDEGVDTSALRTVSESTGIAQVSVTEDGENSIVIVAGANGDATLTAVDEALIHGADTLVVQLERPISLVRQALALAKAAGTRTVLTPAPPAAGVIQILPLVDILVPNAAEALELVSDRSATGLEGESTIEQSALDLSRDTVARAAAELSMTAATVIATRGADGVLIARDGEVSADIPAHAAARVVDTTGAGDTFVGVLVAWLARDATLEEAVAAAVAGASIAVTRMGAAAAAPTRAEIEAAL